MHSPSRLSRIFTGFSGYFSTMSSKPNARWALMLAGLAMIATFAASYVGAHTELIHLWQTRNTIIELRELPLGLVKVRGVVTYVDNPDKRFWLQDETGAIAVDQDPALTGMHFGDVMQVVMRKSHAYDPTIGISSLGLTDFKVARSRRNAPMPLPAKATIPTLSEEAKTGIRVTVEGVVHGAFAKRNGLVQVDIGDEGKEVEAIVPGDPRQFAQWLNARVRIPG